MVLIIGGVDGRKEDYVEVQTNGYWWWCDVRAKDLGCRGKEVKLYYVDKIGGKCARGWTAREFLDKGRKPGGGGWSFMGVATWKLV